MRASSSLYKGALCRCPKCDLRVVDSQFCPDCGAEVNLEEIPDEKKSWLYCPRCNSLNMGCTACLECGGELINTLPDWAEAMIAKDKERYKELHRRQAIRDSQKKKG